METFGLLTINNGFGGGWWCVCFGVCFAQQNRNQRRCELVGEPLEDKIGSNESGVGGAAGCFVGRPWCCFPTNQVQHQTKMPSMHSSKNHSCQSRFSRRDDHHSQHCVQARWCWSHLSSEFTSVAMGKDFSRTLARKLTL